MTLTNDMAPHKCPTCGSAAYLGMNEVQCTNPDCRNYHEATAAYCTGSQRQLVPAKDIQVTIGGHKIKPGPSSFGTPKLMKIGYPAQSVTQPKHTNNTMQGIIDAVEAAIPGAQVTNLAVHHHHGSVQIDLGLVMPAPASKVQGSIAHTIPGAMQQAKAVPAPPAQPGATGKRLDAWANLVGVDRALGETDEALRKRLEAHYMTTKQVLVPPKIKVDLKV